MSEGWTIVHRTTDPVEAGLLEGILQTEGIPVRFMGTRHGASVGVGQHVLKLRLEVPIERFEEAQRLVEQAAQRMDEAAGDEELPEELRPDPEEEEAGSDEADATPRPTKKRALLAIGAVLICPGGSHFYARRWITGWMVCVAELVAIGLLVAAWPRWALFVSGVILLAGLWLFDLLGGLAGVRALNAGKRASSGSQALVGLLAVGLVSAGAFIAGPHVPRPPRKQPQERSLPWDIATLFDDEFGLTRGEVGMPPLVLLDALKHIPRDGDPRRYEPGAEAPAPPEPVPTIPPAPPAEVPLTADPPLGAEALWGFPGPPHTAEITALTTARAAAEVVSGDARGDLCRWSAGTGEVRACLRAHEEGRVRQLAASDAGTVIAVAATREQVYLWQRTGARDQRLHLGELASGVAVSADGRRVALQGRHSVGVFDVEGGNPVARLAVDDRLVWEAAFARGSELLVTIGAGSGLRTWRLPSGDAGPKVELTGRVTAFALSPAGDVVAAQSGEDVSFHALAASGRAPDRQLSGAPRDPAWLHWSANGRWLATSTGRELAMWPVESSEHAYPEEVGAGVDGRFAIATMLADGRVVTPRRDGALIVWSLPK